MTKLCMMCCLLIGCWRAQNEIRKALQELSYGIRQLKNNNLGDVIHCKRISELLWEFFTYIVYSVLRESFEELINPIFFILEKLEQALGKVGAFLNPAHLVMPFMTWIISQSGRSEMAAGMETHDLV